MQRRRLLFAWISSAAAAGAAAAGSEYTAADRSFSIRVPDGWRVRTSEVLGQTMTIVEPNSGGEERVLVGGGVAMATNIQDLSQQAAHLAGQFLPGARFASTPKFYAHGTWPAAEQTYRNSNLAGWNGMFLQGEFYFAVFALARPGREAVLEQTGRAILQSAKFHGLARNAPLERALAGRWLNTGNRTHRTNVRDTLHYISNWSVVFTPDGQFRSEKETWVDTHSEIHGGGNTNASAVHTGTFRVYGNVLAADIAGVGRQLFTVEFYPNGTGVKLNGQLFTRE